MSFFKNLLWALIDPHNFRLSVTPQEILSILESSKILAIILEETGDGSIRLLESNVVFNGGVSLKYSRSENFEFIVCYMATLKPTLFVFENEGLLYLRIGSSEKKWIPPSQEYKQHSNLALIRLKNEIDRFFKSGGK